MTESVRVAIQDSSQVAEARRIARKMAQGIGFDEVRAEQVAIVVTEACTNLVKHAGRGEIIARTFGPDDSDFQNLEILAIDQGPGMGNVEQCMRDGYSTGSSPGQGLGAIQRLSNESDVYSAPSKGTVVLARWSAVNPNQASLNRVGPLQIGAINLSKPGQEVCGDSWGIVADAEFTTILMADGLGHGLEAKQASQEAVRMLRQYPHLKPQPLIERVHQALRSTRGAAVATAQINRMLGTVAFAGVGNISAQIYSGAKAHQHLVSVNGTAGHQIQRIHEFRYPWPDYGILVFFSDGLATGAGLDAHPGLALRDPSVIAGVLYRDFNRGHDDSTVVVAKAA
jgi:anti-sigma regulatory factor (Ser/Thr protein kinase)